MYLNALNDIIKSSSELLWTWPLIIFIISVGLILTLTLGFVQLRYFFKGWKYIFVSDDTEKSTSEKYITPFQAFLNILNTSVGNGSIAGMAVAIMYGGPGAAFWIFLLGFLYMAIRYAEIYLSTSIHEETSPGVIRGGPMVYLKKLPGGKAIAWIYAFFVLGMTLNSAAAMQCNSISLSVQRLINLFVKNPISWSSYVIGLVLLLILFYVMFGGAQRIIKVSDAIVPIKVILFFVPTIFILIYYYADIWPAIKLIVRSALNSNAIVGGTLGFTFQQAIRFGMLTSLNATEAGLGTSGIFYGTIKTKTPVQNSLAAMLTTFISNHLVGLSIILVMLITGVWNVAGLEGTQMTMAAYEAVFGALGAVIVSFLSISFGLGVLIAYSYVGRECWIYLAKGKYEFIYILLFIGMAFVGSIAEVKLIWNLIGIVNAFLLTINLIGIIYLLPKIRSGLLAWQKKKN